MPSPERSNSSGLSLTELLVFIVVAGIFVPFTFIAYHTVLKDAAKPESIVKARFLAESKLEEITSKSFDSISANDCPSGYVPFSGEPTYRWKCSIKFVRYVESGQSITFVESQTETKYKLIELYVKEPKGVEFLVTTLVSKRPLDEE
ncbi:MAG: hypothetical protein NZ583_03975 [Desulfobacterota bacterium]|nr:hypothetical protein [Thermodesulfobacteriota bacterium]MDW8001574.1 hypothetical protein [Deltaproteobacteria bacterium]